FQIICELFELIQIILKINNNEYLCNYNKIIEARKLVLEEHLNELYNYNRKLQLMLLKQWGAKYRIVEFFLGIENIENKYRKLLDLFDYNAEEIKGIILYFYNEWNKNENQNIIKDILNILIILHKLESINKINEKINWKIFKIKYLIYIDSIKDLKNLNIKLKLNNLYNIYIKYIKNEKVEFNYDNLLEENEEINKEILFLLEDLNIKFLIEFIKEFNEIEG
ncbi:hypothetical protein Mgra_00008126, partial [Meloidogyne graminicola]